MGLQTAPISTAAQAALNAKAALSHAHGNVTNSGAIGSTAGVPIITGANGVLQAGAFGSVAGTFCQGDDNRLSDAREPGGIFWVNLGGVYIPQYGYLNGKPRYYLQSLRDDGWTDFYDVSFQSPSINKWRADWYRVDDEGNGRSGLWVVSTSTNVTDYPWQATWIGVQPTSAPQAAVLAKATAIPAPPASGTYVFRAVNGVAAWVAA